MPPSTAIQCNLALPLPQSRRRDPNRVLPEDRWVHDWYRFVLSFPPHLVRSYLARFGLGEGARVLDPFCGTGTTAVEAKRMGMVGIGVEANPVAHFASRVKADWSVDPDEMRRAAERVARTVRSELLSQGVPDDPTSSPGGAPSLRTANADAARLLLKGSISPRPLHKALVLLDALRAEAAQPWHQHHLLALAKTLVDDASNLRFGPEVGVGRPKEDAAVVAPWLARVLTMARDLEDQPPRTKPAQVHRADARSLAHIAEPESIDAVITSPPYPNEKDYSRTTRLESVILGFTPNLSALRAVKQSLVRSNTRSVYAADTDHRWVAANQTIQQIAAEIETRRIARGKTSGFERRYAWLTQLYFGGMARHLADLRPLLSPGAQLAYVVGDQASYLQVMIRTGTILADIAESLGYVVDSIDLFRTRLATATREQLREEVLVLRWPGRR